MKNINDYRKRFYSLMESKMGDVRPLLLEKGDEEKPKSSDELAKELETEMTDEQKKNMTMTIDGVSEEIKKDLGSNPNMSKLLQDSDFVSELSMALSSSDATPPGFLEDIHAYSWKAILTCPNAANNKVYKTVTASGKPASSPDLVRYLNIENKVVEVTPQQIINEINSANLGLYTAAETVDGSGYAQYVLGYPKDPEGDGKSKILGATLQENNTYFSGNEQIKNGKAFKATTLSIQLCTMGDLAPTVEEEGADTTTTEGGVEITTRKPTLKPLTLEGGKVSGENNLFTFNPGDDKLAGDSLNTLLTDIKQKIDKMKADEAEANKIDVKTITATISSINIICSASNVWSATESGCNPNAILTPTHSNDGTSTNQTYNASVDYILNPSKGKPTKTKTVTVNSDKNYNLSTRRGQTLYNLFKVNYSQMGLSSPVSVEPTYDIRVTDTGGCLDGKNTLYASSSFSTKFGFAGQYAKIELQIGLTGIQPVPGKVTSRFVIAQFRIKGTLNLNTKKPRKAWGFDFTKGKYTNSNWFRKMFGLGIKRRSRPRGGDASRGFTGFKKIREKLHGFR